jgi:D-glycero-alpha-D-manno-heptose-7-phosphate kinase
MLGIDGGVEITSVADIPAKGTGLGSSSSFTVGLLNALHAYSGHYASAAELAEQCCRIEIERCGEPIGKQDQYAAAFGGFNFIRFNPDDTVEVQKVLCKPEVVTELQSKLMFFYTGITRSASTLLREQSAQMSASKAKTDGMAEMVALAERAFADLCEGRIDALGPMLHDAWQIKRSMTNGISNPLIDDAYGAAIEAGAEGGKLLGAGGGGFLMFIVPEAKQPAVRAALSNLRETPFKFSPQGSNIIFVH